MSHSDSLREAGGISPPATVKVWDPFIRVFHWSLVLLFAIAFLTGDEIEWMHLWAGYAIAALVGLRILWGFIGSRHARFSDFVKGPSTIFQYLKQSTRLEAPRYVGHNPAGGAMIVLLIVMLIGLSITGYLMTTDAFWGSKPMEEVHEALANITLGLVALHVLGVILASLEHGENLVKAMITGRKRSP
ncbi:cytochrome b/b6 domain-containing protein [Hyphomicrobium sp. 99]|uniref:cytochrome b/b6 domain-containing protein n=1 Tax=Hyphomicrobium sp. 99 TaxID=1163419 RepID=UPI0005F7AA72|nr:cytochrome b/b6 domain-containing protein [Hyphomicrobium sp. 99]